MIKDKIISALKKNVLRTFPRLFSLRHPRIIAIEATNRCFLRCKTCPIPAHMTRGKGNMSMNTFRRLIDQIHWKVTKLSWNFGGEPLLNEHLFDMIKIAWQKGIPSKVDTNGMLLGKFVEQVFTPGLKVLNIAFEGLSEESTSSFRMGYDFKLVLENIEKVCKWKQKYGLKHPDIYLNYLVKKNNEYEIEETIKVAKRMGVDFITLKSLNITPSAWLSEEEFQAIGNEFLPVKHTDLLRYERKNGKWIPKNTLSGFCTYLSNSITLTWDGKVLPCCFDFDGKMKVGDIREKSLEEIWISEEFLELRKKVIANQVGLCKNCTPLSPQKLIFLKDR